MTPILKGVPGYEQSFQTRGARLESDGNINATGTTQIQIRDEDTHGARSLVKLFHSRFGGEAFEGNKTVFIEVECGEFENCRVIIEN